MRALVLALVGGLSACASSGLMPHVAPLSPEGAARTAYDIADFVGQQVPPSAGSIAVLHPPGDSLLWPQVTADLRTAGYTVTDGQARHHLRFAIDTLPDGTFLRATLDAVSAARLYHEEPGNRLAPSGPFTVQQAEE